MKSNLRRTRIVFEARREQSDEAGNERADWIFKFETWARRRFLVGGESVQAARLAGTSPVLFNVERNSKTREITTEWRCRDKYSFQEYNIRSITPTEDDRDLDILTTTGAAV